MHISSDIIYRIDTKLSSDIDIRLKKEGGTIILTSTIYEKNLFTARGSVAFG